MNEDYISIKTQLCDLVATLKEDDSLTYEDLKELSGLNTTQITRILKKNGNGVSLQVIEQLLIKLDAEVGVHQVMKPEIE